MWRVKSAILALAVASVANAQTDTDAPSDEQARALETLTVTGTRFERLLTDESLSLSVVDKTDIDTVGHVHISQLLNRVPGVWISRGNGQEHLTAIRSSVLTGAGSCGAFFFAEDGIPLRSRGFCNVNELFDVNSEQAGRIEVLRGPGTAVHGSNALNGVINVISAAPSEEPEGRLSFEGGPHDYSRVAFQHSDSGDKQGYRISAHGSHDGGYKDDSGFDQQKMTLRHDYQGETWHVQSLLSGSNLNQETAGYVLGEDAYEDSSRKRENPNPEAYRNATSVRAYSRFEREGTQDSHLVVTPYLRYTEMEFLQHFLPGTPLEQNGERSVGVQTAFYRQTDDDLVIHNGFDMEVTKAYLEQSQEAPSFASFPTGDHYDYEVDALYGAWFVGADWDASESTKLSLGARYDIQLYDYDNQMIDGNTAADGSACPSGTCRYARPADDKERFRNWSFNAGLVQNLGANTDFVVNLANGFRAPQASELYRLQAQQLSAKLDEESLNSVDIGLRGSWPTVNYSVTVFWLQKDDIIVQDSQRRNFNGGKTEGRGIEVAFDWAITRSLSWHTQASYSKHEYANDALTDEGNELDTAPRQIASTQLRWQPYASTAIEVEAAHTGEYYLDADNQFDYPGHTLLHLRWRQHFGDHLYTVVRVQNATDEDYADRADYAFGNYRYFIGEPRAVFLEVGLNL
ncbi:TonB-dependent receptor [Spongiibacter nanhainus]|uniref:TonB-dependent receptor n=1 Tax=Spongiibacter nanhainus TaxID=2794344 RepID=A0A7T4UR74_9GAMM|nr:TonB-dependent receptor [Spongiibacter nanhainus]QQD19237.1 TonB-dependent receptor [Spongiibacter nanhainus]